MSELTLKDVGIMLNIIKANYTYAYKDISREDLQILRNTWYKILSQHDKDVVYCAFYKSLETCKMPPTIADLTNIILDLYDAAGPSNDELWSGLRKIIYHASDLSRAFYYTYLDKESGKTQGQQAREDFEHLWTSMEPLLKEYLGTKSNLIALTKVDNLEYEKTRFLKTMPEIKKRLRLKQEVLPKLEGLDIEKITYKSREG